MLSDTFLHSFCPLTEETAVLCSAFPVCARRAPGASLKMCSTSTPRKQTKQKVGRPTLQTAVCVSELRDSCVNIDWNVAASYTTPDDYL